MYKMIVIDIDGTLLTSDGIITEETKEATEEIKEDVKKEEKAEKL